MARAGEEIYNPVQGDRIVFRQTPQESGGEVLRLDVIASPQAAGPPPHVHPLQQERFEVLSGTLSARLGDQEIRLREGEHITVSAGTPHTWWNDGQEAARVLVEFRPALNTETFLETLYGLAGDGKIGEAGVPNLVQFAVMLNGLNKGELYLAKPPMAVQKALFALLSPVGKLLGYKDHYPKYSAAQTPSGEGAGPPSITRVMARGVALVVSLLVASLFLVGRARRLRSKG